MAWIVYQFFVILLIGLSSKTSLIHAKSKEFCRLENRTVTFDICEKSPRLTLPFCVGYCSSTIQWSFRSNKFLRQSKACRVTAHRTEYFLCPDSTHTAVQLMIPLACACRKYSCHR